MADAITLSEAFSGIQLVILAVAVIIYERRQAMQNQRIRELEIYREQFAKLHEEQADFRRNVYGRLDTLEKAVIEIKTLLKQRNGHD